MPDIKLPAVKLPEIKLPQVKLPEVKLPEIDLSIMSASTGGHRALIRIDGANLETPPLEHLVYYVGIAVFVELNLIELPVAAALVVGHLLIGLTHRPGLQALGEVIEEG